MKSRLSSRPVIALGWLCAFSLTALAEEPANAVQPCPDNALQQINAIATHFQTAASIEQQAVNYAVAAAPACADNQIALYTLASAWFELAKRNGPSNEEKMMLVNRSMDLLIKADNLPVTAHNYSAVSDLRKAVSQAAIELIEAGADPAPYFVAGNKFGTCSSSWANVSQVLWYAYRKDWSGTAEPAFIQNLSESCQGEKSFFGHRYYGDLLVANAVREEDPHKALDLMKQARATLLLGDYNREQIRSDKYTEDQFNAIYDGIRFKVLLADPPEARAEWFTPDKLSSGETRTELAATLNEIWGRYYTVRQNEITKDQFSAQLGAYTRFLRSAYEQSKAAGPEARQVVFETVRDHANGALRSEATKDYGAPNELLWSWLDPARPDPTFSDE